LARLPANWPLTFPILLHSGLQSHQSMGDVAVFATERWTLQFPATVLPSRQPHNRANSSSLLPKQFVTRIGLGQEVRKVYFHLLPPRDVRLLGCSFLGLSARRLLVLYKPARLLHLHRLVLLPQELLFREVVPIILHHRRILHTKKDLVRPRSVWTTSWPPSTVSTDPKIHQWTQLQRRRTQGAHQR